MKILKSLVAIAIIVLISVPFSSCDDTTDESCEQQDMNDILDCGFEKNVEVCCETGFDCVYKYDGQEYPDTNPGLNDLADALGCTYKSSDNYKEQHELIINTLITMKERARIGCY
jgi:hypothetical protein